MALIPLNTFKTKTATLSTLNYDQAKGARDTGLIIDSIALDLLFGGNTQTTFSAYQYWKHSGINIPSNYNECLSALQHAKNITLWLITRPAGTPIKPTSGEFTTYYSQLPTLTGSPVVGDATLAKIASEFDLIMEIIRTGPSGTSELVEPNSITETTDADMIRARNRIVANKEYIKNEVKKYINDTFDYGYYYNEDKCARDTGLMVEALAFDLLFSGDSQSTFAGMQYWAQGTTNVLTNITGETAATLAALDRLKTILNSLILNQQVINSDGNVLTPNIDYTVTGSLTSKIRTEQLIDIIKAIISNGTNGITIPDITKPTMADESTTVTKYGSITDLIISNGSITSDDGFLNAATILQENKLFIQKEIIAWLNINHTELGFETAPVASDTCFRDVGYIIDSLTFDLRYGGNKQSIQSGVNYWSYSTADNQLSSVANEEVADTIAAYTYLEKVVSNVITGTPIDGIYQQTDEQVTNLPTGTTADATSAVANIELIIDIIKNGPAGRTRQPIGLIESYSVYTQHAFDILIANIPFIKAEIIAYIDVLTQTVILPVTSMIIDGKYTIKSLNGTTNWVQMGAASATVGTHFTYNGVAAITTGTPVTPGTVYSGFKYNTNDNSITEISGPTGTLVVGQSYTIKTAGSTDWNVIADTTGITYADGDTFVARVATFNGTGVVYELSTGDKSKRDIGFVLDSILFDINYSGNRQAIQAGVYYFNNDSEVSVLAAETTCALNAFNYMGIIMNAVIEKFPVSQNIVNQDQNGINFVNVPYQTAIPLFTNLTALGTPTHIKNKIYNPSDNIGGLIDVMNRIINNGIPIPAPVRVPIGRTKTTNLDTLKAVDLILANKNYIIAEINGYMNSTKSVDSTKIYTAPPGVTAIVLMASAANVTDHDVTVTLAHYRNLPVYPDPATLNGYQEADTTTELVKEFTIPPNDASSLVSGKLVIETFDSVVAYASESNGIKLTLSILETANA